MDISIFYGEPEKFFKPDDFVSNLIYSIQKANSIGLQGMYMEFGVFNGRTLKLISDYAPINKKIYGFDSNLGLPENWHRHPKGDFKGKMPADENYVLIEGWFNETLPKFKKQIVSFLHIDCDLYSSTKTILDNLMGYIIPGTVIVFDEYHGYPTYQDHEYKAFKEFLDKTKLKCRTLSIVEPHVNPSPASFLIV